MVIGKIVKVIVDRPLGSYHPKHKEMYYPINYGFVEGVIAPDGEEQDAYILGIDIPVKEFVGKIIAIIHRDDDVEEKWVVAPDNTTFTIDEIMEQVNFQEQQKPRNHHGFRGFLYASHFALVQTWCKLF